MSDAVSLTEIAAGASGPGVVWTQRGSGELNVNLVRFPEAAGVGEHVNDEADVLFLGVSGSGFLVVDGEEIPLGAGRLVFVSKGASRATRSTSEGFAYLTVHRRRGPLPLRPR
jgi:quercetin dioxygenase-like cupin family protein